MLQFSQVGDHSQRTSAEIGHFQTSLPRLTSDVQNYNTPPRRTSMQNMKVPELPRVYIQRVVKLQNKVFKNQEDSIA